MFKYIMNFFQIKKEAKIFTAFTNIFFYSLTIIFKINHLYFENKKMELNRYILSLKFSWNLIVG